MAKYKIEKEGNIYYARVYSNRGMLLDSIGESSRVL
jgi:hypothetical protein